jgi:hypothetical protein
VAGSDGAGGQKVAGSDGAGGQKVAGSDGAGGQKGQRPDEGDGAKKGSGSIKQKENIRSVSYNSPSALPHTPQHETSQSDLLAES